MRVLFFSHYFPPEGNAPASRTYENCRRWVREGHEVTVVTCAPNCPDGVLYDGYKNRLRQREEMDGIEVVRVWTFLAANKGAVRRTINYLSYLFSAVFFAVFLKRPDAVVATSPQFFCGWAGLIASKLRRLPFILEIRDIWPESIVAVGALRGRRLVRFLEWLEARMYAAAPHIVTVGEGYRRQLLEKGVPPERISVITNGVDRERFAPREPDAALKQRLGLEGKFVCGYVGTVGMACGLEVVLRAAELLRERGRDDVAFLLVGDGAVRKDLETRARERGLDNVVFTGRQDKQLMPNYLSISDACLIHLKKKPLFATVLPSKIFEAAGMARPLIVGVAGFASALVRQARAGVCIEPENETELADAVERLAGDLELRRALGRAGREHVLAHYDRDRLAGDYLEVIRRVCSRARAPKNAELSA